METPLSGDGRVNVSPKIVRLHGVGHVVREDDPEYAELRVEFGKPLDLGCAR